MPRKTPKATPSKSSLAKSGSPLLEDLRQLIEHARNRVARQVNTDLVMLNWHIGVRIRRDILQEQRAEYGQQIIDALALELSMEYGPSLLKRSQCIIACSSIILFIAWRLIICFKGTFILCAGQELMLKYRKLLQLKSMAIK